MTAESGEPALRVWAPAAGAVIAVVGNERLPMTPGRDGWWELVSPELPAGTEYAFAIDGGEPMPDPRSALQPHGVHGRSAVVDLPPAAVDGSAWSGIRFEDAVLYEVHIGTFTDAGTLDAAIGHLDHLVDLGVTAVELLPVAHFPGEAGWGYDGVDMFAVHTAYGGPEALRRFVDACHGRGIACILDVVYNHVGPDGNYLGEYGPYFTDKYGTPWGKAINVDDYGSDEVRAFIVDNAVHWVRDMGLDGVRLDAVHAIVDASATHILEELATAVHAVGDEQERDVWVIAESDLNDPRVVRPPGVGGFGCDAQWSDDFHHALWVALTGERDGYYADFEGLVDVVRALHAGVVYDGRQSGFRGRRHGRAYTGVPRWRLLGYLQNHDQIGNRAAGERSGALLEPARLRAAAAIVLLAPFTPMLFMGEEWGATTPWQYFTDHSDPALAVAVSGGRRREFASFGWRPEDVPDPQDVATFARSHLDWAEPNHEPHAGILSWHRSLVGLRRTMPELRDGSLDDAYRPGGRDCLVMRRGRVLLVTNLEKEPVPVDLPVWSRVLLASDDGPVESGPTLTVPGGATWVLEIGRPDGSAEAD